MMEYEISTPVFSGPLGVLLELIQRHKLDITQVALAQVTDEFLCRIEALRETQQVAVVADFLAVAARLLLIKSQVLLPSPVEMPNDVDEGEVLVRQLRAYKHYKEMAVWLRERDDRGLHCYQHWVEWRAPTRVSLDLGGCTPIALRQMVSRVLFRTPPSPVHAVQPPRWSIVTQIFLVRQQLIQLSQVTYQGLLRCEPTRDEAVVTLLAILELIKQQAVFARQERSFGEIVIEPLIPPEQILLHALPTTERNLPQGCR